MNLVYSDKYEVDLGNHPFITTKYRLVSERLVKEGLITPRDLLLAPYATDEDLLLVHTKEYVDKIKSLSLSFSELLVLELPLSKEIVDASIICCGGTILACELALKTGIGIHIGGGFHHSFPDHGEGFCIFNDMAIAIKKMEKERKARKFMIIDCDLHQGNGNAYIFRDNKNVFTFSIHEENIYPIPKQKSSLDIGLPAGTTDEEYLLKLQQNIPDIIDKHKPELILYQAGADLYEYDQLGHLKLTKEGILNRDKFIYEQVKNRDIPIVVLLGGGYSIYPKDTVAIHTNTIKIFLGK